MILYMLDIKILPLALMLLVFLSVAKRAETVCRAIGHEACYRDRECDGDLELLERELEQLLNSQPSKLALPGHGQSKNGL